MKTYSRGLKYTPLDTPYRVKFVGDKVYPFPSLTQLNVFKRDVDNMAKLYAQGTTLYNIDGTPLDNLEEAIDTLYKERYDVWLRNNQTI